MGYGRDSTSSGLLGREHPVAVLRAELDRTLDSHGKLVLVTGEAGIGKTALVRQIADDARQRAAIVVHGSSWDDAGAPGYWPWIQVVRELQQNTTPDEWATARAAAGDSLAHLLGESAEYPRRPLSEDLSFRLHDALTTLLVTVSRNRPLVVVLDDLHWADVASVKLLDFVARHTWFERLLVIATYRDVEVEPGDHPLKPFLARLLSRADTITLTGLAAADVRTLVARTIGNEPEAELSEEVHRRTGGNPFLVEQAARLLHSSGKLDAGTPGIREALQARLAHLPAPALDMLTAAAVVGREFDPELLTMSAGLRQPDLGAALEQATTARLVTDLGDGRFAFVHDMVRETLYASMDAEEKRDRHAAVTRGLEHRSASGHPVRSGDLAHHAYLAMPTVHPEEARRHLLAAAQVACQRLAADEMVHHLRRALALAPEGELRTWADTALDLAAAQDWAGDLTDARATLERVVAVNHELRDAGILARAAFGLHDLGSPEERGQREIDLLDEAHAALEADGVSGHANLAVRVLAAASRARIHLAPDERTVQAAEEMSSRAVALARQHDDEALGFSLLARHDAIWRPGTAPGRETLADEIAAVARRIDDIELRLQASLLRMVALLELGDPRALQEHESFTAMAERSRLPRWRFLALSRHGTIAALTGRLEQARASIDSAFALGERIGEVDRVMLWREQSWALALTQGDFDEADRLAATFQTENFSHSRLISAVNAAQRGDASNTHANYAAITTMANDYPRMYSPAFLQAQAQIAATSGDPRLCEEVRTALVPLRDLWVVVAGGGAVYGPYAHWLARIDAAQELWDEAIDGFAAAQRSADRLNARPWSIDARLHRAQALTARGSAGDTDDAAALLDDVVREAEELGMRHTAEQAQNALTAIARAPGINGRGHAIEQVGSTNPNIQAEPANEFRFDGHVWYLSFAGRTAHMPDAKGLRDLHTLLGRPGADLPAPDLLSPQGGDMARSVGRLGADAVLDERAKSEYRRRLTQLDDEIEQAIERYDDTRAAELDQERQALLDELRHATGLGGRTRRLGDEGERARKTVTARIRDTMRRIDAQHPELAEHLRASVSTGVTCRYQPTRAVKWVL